MSERNNRVLSSLLLAFLLGASVLMVTPVDGFPVSQQQQAVITGLHGAGNPADGWQTRQQTTRLYLNSPPTSSTTPAGTIPIAMGSPGLPGAPYIGGLEMPIPQAPLTAVPVLLAPTTQADAMAFYDSDDRMVMIGVPANAAASVGDPAPPTSASAVLRARFEMTPTTLTLDPVTITEVSAQVSAACDSRALAPSVSAEPGTAQRPGGIRAHIDLERLDTATGKWSFVRRFTNDGDGNAAYMLRPSTTPQPEVIQSYVGQVAGQGTSNPIVVGNPAVGSGIVLQPGVDRMVLILEIPSAGASAAGLPAGQCVVHYGSASFRSALILKDDSARVATFTEDAAGNDVTGFPRGSSSSSAQRQVLVHALQASPYGAGASQQLSYETNVRLRNVDTNAYVYYVEDFNDSPPKERDISDIDLTTRVDEMLSDNLVRRTFTFNYPTTLDEGTFQVEFYAEDQGWVLMGSLFKIGARGITLSLLPGESASHLINLNEPTEFSFVLRNIGSEDDVSTVTVTDPGGGWTARVLGGGQFFLSPGMVAIGAVELVPPVTGVAGNQRSVTIHASSSFADVLDPAELTVSATLTNTVTRGVEISAVSNQLQIRPGETKGYAVTLSNLGTMRDNFVVVSSFPNTIQGWSVAVQPTSLQMVAGARGQLNVLVTAPAEAATGMSFPLTLTAREVGNAAVADSIELTVKVLGVEGLFMDIAGGPLRGLREDNDKCRGTAVTDAISNIEYSRGQTRCALQDGRTGTLVLDTDSDNSALFRLQVNNLGDSAERYRVTAVWDTFDTSGGPNGPAGTDDAQGCDGDPTGSGNGGPDGVPDGWRFNWGDKVATPLPASRQLGSGQHQGAGFSGVYTLADGDKAVVVPARSIATFYHEIGFVSGIDPSVECPSAAKDEHGSKMPWAGYSNTAQMLLTLTSLKDASRTFTVPMMVKIADAGTYLSENRFSGGTHDVGIEPVGGEATTKHVSGSQPGIFNLIATNKGNERDGVKLFVSGAQGWTHSVSVNRTVPAGLPCELPAADGSITCPNMGVYEEAYFTVVATPGPSIQVGDVDPITVTVLSTDAPGIARTLSLVARASGTYDFDLTPRGATTRSVVAGQTVSFPFVIGNEGTADDSYRLSLLSGSPAWQPVLSSSAPVFVPASYEMPSLLTVTGPAAAVAGFSDTFRIKAESVGSGTIKTFEVTPVVQAATGLTVFGKDGQDVLIASRNTLTNVTVKAIQTSGAPATQATFTVDSASLPPGWTVDRTSATVPMTADASGRPAGEAVFRVKAPADALGTAYGLLHVDAVTVGSTPIRAGTDLRLNLASTFGVELNSTFENGTKMVIAPGGPAIFNLTVRNLGLGSDTFTLSSTPVPAGWAVLFNPGTMTLGPLQKRTVEVKLIAPNTAQPADIASLIVFATSTNSPTELDTIALSAQVGFNALRLEVVDDTVLKAAPQESNVWVLNLTNKGTLPDQVKLTSKLDTTALSGFINGSIEPALVTLEPNQTVQVRVMQTFNDAIPSAVTVQGKVIATSLLDARAVPASANVTLVSEVLPYAASDMNRDSRPDFAVDRNEDASDGFEEFRASQTPGGRPIESADLQRFLSETARESFSRDITLANGSVERVLVYVIDGDGDGKVDHFLDSDADGQPDYYWDPDANQASPIEFRKDINGDQVPESFVDTDGDGRQDAVFDLTRGTFTDVIQIDVDGDGKLDYVVDKDGDGQVDQDETVLYTRTGGLLIVQKVDVDGDGKLDQVFDTNGDGAPDYFIPNGSTDSVPIVMRDVNGDGVQDWTFDGDNDGRNESYYDPATGKSHVVNAAGHFVEALKEYWYIGALFALVLVLFVALVIVTRR